MNEEVIIKVEEITRQVNNGTPYILVKETENEKTNKEIITYSIKTDGQHRVTSDNYVIVKAIWDLFWSIL